MLAQTTVLAVTNVSAVMAVANVSARAVVAVMIEANVTNIDCDGCV